MCVFTFLMQCVYTGQGIPNFKRRIGFLVALENEPNLYRLEGRDFNLYDNLLTTFCHQFEKMRLHWSPPFLP